MTPATKQASRSEMSFLTELKRRNVYRVAVLYLVISWLILQVVDVLMSFLPLPEWTGRLIIVLLLVGFPIALVLAWAFELTPQGVRRESSFAADAMTDGRRHRRFDLVIMGALAVALAYFAWQHDWREGPHGSEPEAIRSIVVLPLENLMNDPGQAYFVSGMHEALITELSKIEALRVISRTSAMRLQGGDMSVPEIGRELGVQAVIEGSVLRAGDTVRITVQLIEASNDRHLWAENYDRQLSDILVLYGEVTREIASQVRVNLSADEEAKIDASRPVDPEVYELYLEGRYLCDNWSPDEMNRGIALLQEVVSRDTGNAPAHAQLALCLQYSAFFGYERPLDVYSRAKAAAAMAVQLDDRLAEAHVALAGVHYYMELNPKAAKRGLERALDLNPASVKALLHSSWLLGESGQFEQAHEHNRRALSLDPLSIVVNHAVGQLFYLGRDYQSAVVEYRKVLDMDRTDPSLHFYLAWPLEQLGRYEEAITHHKKAVELSGGSPLYLAGLAYAYGLAGSRAEAMEIRERLLQDPAAAPYDIALAHLGLGDHVQAVDWLEKAYEARDSHVIYINRGPRFDPLRNDARFIRLLQRIDFPAGDEPLPTGG
jgi:TolB-like protein/Flp pilus assembly protein TadD